jgi:hypothetical protein
MGVPVPPVDHVPSFAVQVPNTLLMRPKSQTPMSPPTPAPRIVGYDKPRDIRMILYVTRTSDEVCPRVEITGPRPSSSCGLSAILIADAKPHLPSCSVLRCTRCR